MKFSPDFLQKIKNAVNLIEIVGEHVVLKKSGSNYTGLCPFHSERSPSFSVSETKQLYHCYGCQKGGDLVGFIMEMHGLSFPEAIESLAERARIVIPESERGALGKGLAGPGGGEQREKQTRAFRLNRFIAAHFHQNLAYAPDAQAYLAKRGVSAEMQREFYIGVASTSWDALTQHLVQAKAPLDVAAQLGVIRPSPAGRAVAGPGFYDLFRGRVIFPILDLRGRVTGFGGRTQGDEQPKYLNSSESFLFQKSKILYGLMQAQKHIREKDEAILVEGYFDVVALHGAGIRNVVATCGTALTPEHLQLLKRLTSRIVVLFDADKAGRSATVRAMELGLGSGWVLHGASLPDGLDPDEMVLKGPEGVEALRSLIAGAEPLLDRAIREIWATGVDSETKTVAIKQIAAWLAQFTDPVGRAIRIEQLQKEYGISPAVLGSAKVTSAPQSPSVSRGPQVQAGRPRPNPTPPQARPAAAPPVIKLSPAEKALLKAIAWGSPWLDQVTAARDKLPPGITLTDLFDLPGARALVDRLANEPGFIESFRSAPHQILETIEDRQVRSVLTEIWMRSAESDASEFGLEQEGLAIAIVQRLKLIWARFSHGVLTELRRAEVAKDAELHDKWLKEYLDVKRKMMEFVTFYDET